jgi:hypothetical protein
LISRGRNHHENAIRLSYGRTALPDYCAAGKCAAAAVNGLKLAEIFARGTADLTGGYGNTAGYFVFEVENGDKFFAHYTSVLQSASGKITVTTVGHITGGTGRLAEIQGAVRQVTNIGPRRGGVPGDAEYEIEYSIDK